MRAMAQKDKTAAVVTDMREGMTRVVHVGLVVAIAVTVGTVAARAGEFQDANRKLFVEYCAVCHGDSGKGGGPAASRLTKAPPDLTRLARDNGGEFPRERVMRAIDGRDLPRAHRRPDMPRWGDEFAADYTDPFRDEYGVRMKVHRLAEYVRSIQEPAK
jgi:mono/diheme cytochrome c family protein